MWAVQKKGEETSDVIFHACAQTTHVERWPLNLAYGVGSRTYSTMPSFMQIDIQVLASWGLEICRFPILSAMAYTTGSGYHPTRDTATKIRPSVYPAISGKKRLRGVNKKARWDVNRGWGRRGVGWWCVRERERGDAKRCSSAWRAAAPEYC